MLCLIGLVSACVPQAGQDGDASSLASSWVRPDDPQEKLGAQEHPVVLAKYGGEYSSPQAERLIAVIVGKLVAVSTDPSRVYKIVILNSPKVNAFALPGGFLYITRGLLALANDSSELAAVIAHEMAHVSSDHAILRREKLSSAALGEKIVAEVLGGNLAGQVALAANQIKLSKFSQSQELQADTIGIRMIGNAGFDPFAAARFLETMSAYRSFLSGKADTHSEESFISSHPTTPKRVALAVRHARFFGAPGVGERGRERYLEGVDGLMYGDTAEEGFVRGRKFFHTGLGVTFKAPDDFRLDNQAKAVMLSGPGDVATRFDAAVLSSKTSLSDYLKSGWISGLMAETIKEEFLNGLPSATAIAVGDGWRFRVRIIRNGSQLYRFITAAPQTNTKIDAISKRITRSFRRLTKLEIIALEPLELKVVKVGFGQNEKWMASKMKGVSKPLELLKLINGLKPDEAISAGQKIKIVSES